jgi:hypothetical protein
MREVSLFFYHISKGVEKMEESLRIEKVRHHKDGETRDRNGRWAGKVVTVRKEYYALIEAWQKKSGLKRAQFWREAVMRGALEVAKSYGIEASFPVLEPGSNFQGVQVKPKRAFPAWLFRKR